MVEGEDHGVPVGVVPQQADPGHRGDGRVELTAAVGDEEVGQRAGPVVEFHREGRPGPDLLGQPVRCRPAEIGPEHRVPDARAVPGGGQGGVVHRLGPVDHQLDDVDPGGRLEPALEEQALLQWHGWMSDGCRVAARVRSVA